MAISHEEIAIFFLKRGVTYQKVPDKINSVKKFGTRKEMRLLRKVFEFNFEGTIIKVPSEYDESSGKYILEVPDFEEAPIYTPSGKPLITAVQDRCKFVVSSGDESDCGSCEFFKKEKNTDLIGICINEKKNINYKEEIK